MVDDYEPLFLSTQDQLLAHWPLIEPLLLTAPIMDDFSTDDILQAAIDKKMFVFAFLKETMTGPDIRIILVLAPIIYPKLKTITVVTVAGKDMFAFAARFWEFVKGWCYMNGARAIDAYVPERFEPVIARLGFRREAVHVRLRLTA